MKRRAKDSSFSIVCRIVWGAVVSASMMVASAHFTVVAQGFSRLDEVGMRWTASDAPKPTYPKTAIDKQLTGVVVVSVIVAEDGRVATLFVMESPDPLLASAVREAVQRWKFRSQSHPGPNGTEMKTRMEGKLTFYFRIDHGIGQVLNPEEMPGARWPKRRVPGSEKAKEPVKAKVFKGVPEASITMINKQELERQIASVHPVILDIRERDAFRRGHLDGAVNIPFGELQVRAPIELPAARPMVIDCSQDETWCANPGTIVQVLRWSGFTRLTVYR